MKLLEEDAETPGKRLRSSSADNTNMYGNTHDSKKRRSSLLIEGMDNTSQPPPVINISPTEPLNVFLAVCDKEYPDDEMDDPYGPTTGAPKTPEVIKEKIDIRAEINGLDDLLKLIKQYPLVENVEYNIDMESLHKIEPSLLNLHSMIGMNALKDHVVDQIITICKDSIRWASAVTSCIQSFMNAWHRSDRRSTTNRCYILTSWSSSKQQDQDGN